jgi:autoinducer 2-degrading protein
MYIVSVDLRVKADKVHEFLRFTLDNAARSREEPGCLRFDVLRQEKEPERFLFHEVYRSPEDLIAHQGTEHYVRWKENVPPLLAEPRASRRYVNVDPPDERW